MNIEDYAQSFVAQIQEVLQQPYLNQRNFSQVIDIAQKAIRELNDMEGEWDADREMSMTEQRITESWILKHPARIGRPGQIEIVRSVPNFDKAVAEASKFHSMLSEKYSRSRVMHDSTKDFFTVVEMEQGATPQEVREAFINGKGYVKLVHLNDLFR